MEPIERIEWRDAKDLRANYWNPNRVAKQEFRLLEHSILKSGWLQPILINTDNLIIDGFHRWRLSCDSKKMNERWGGKVPCVVMDLPDDEAMAQTVRINKAKGKHMVVNMQQMLRGLRDDYGWEKARIQKEFGMTKQEVDIILAENIFAAMDNLESYEYSQAWYPTAPS